MADKTRKIDNRELPINNRLEQNMGKDNHLHGKRPPNQQ